MAEVPSHCLEKQFLLPANRRHELFRGASCVGKGTNNEQKRAKGTLVAAQLIKQHQLLLRACALDHIKANFSCLLCNKMAKISRREKRKSAFFVCF